VQISSSNRAGCRAMQPGHTLRRRRMHAAQSVGEKREQKPRKSQPGCSSASVVWGGDSVCASRGRQVH
jgi:hypothetical protein